MARPVQKRTPEQDAQLARLVEAAKNLDRARETYRRAFLATEAAGVTQSAMAKALGISIESVRRFLLRNR